MVKTNKNADGCDDKHKFTTESVELILDSIVNRTLGEIDVMGVFKRTIVNPKITGIAGDVIEQSVLGYGANSDQSPDITIDGVETEVKVTGIKKSTKGGDGDYEAKEPMSITAVSVEAIVSEEFEISAFKHKIDQMLIVYYLYDSPKTVPAAGYASFPVMGYEIHRFNEKDMQILKHDWTAVREFVKEIQTTYDNPGEGYPKLSRDLRDVLMYIDTAPKWPNRPRFRLKRSVVTTMVQDYFRRMRAVEGSNVIDGVDTFEDLDRRCSEVTQEFMGCTVDELLDMFGIEVKNRDRMPKSIAESIVVRMFGGGVGKMSDIDLFRMSGVVPKTICVTSKGRRTEDMKLMPVDIDEFFDEQVSFEESMIYDYFANHQFLCILFQEMDERQAFRDNVFKGIKRVLLPMKFVETEVRSTWDDARAIVHSGKLKETVCLDKDGKPVVNKNGSIRTSINLPKSHDHTVFFRGTGASSNDKREILCGMHVYHQNIWIKGSVIVSILEDTDFF